MCEICNGTNQTGNELLDVYVNDYQKTIDSLAEASFELTNSKELKGCMLFKTHTDSLFDTFLSMLPEGEIRQHFNCNMCRSFFHRYGNLVAIYKDGCTASIIWNENYAHGKFKEIVKKLAAIVETSKIIQVLSWLQKTYVTTHEEYYEYGCSCTGEYHHFHADISKNIRMPDYGCSSDESRQIYVTIKMALKDYAKVIDRAVAIASTGKLNNKNTLFTLKAVKSIIDDVNSSKTSRQKDNKIWKYAFEQYSLLYHLRGSVEGSLMDDILKGIDDSIAIERFNNNMDPMKYMRPTSAPTTSLVEEAEKIIADLNLKQSLNRRIASIDDVITFIWKEPEVKEQKEETGGVFANVKTKDAPKDKMNNNLVDITADPTRITFEKFAEKVLPDAKAIFIYALSGFSHYPLMTLVTASNYDAEPILKYDSKDQRNPLSQYLYNGGSYLEDFNITSSMVRVLGICPNAENMHNLKDNKSVLFIMEGCRDLKRSGGSALFPEILRRELYPVRKVIESYSGDKELEDLPIDKQAAAGMFYNGYKVRVIVETDSTRMSYIIDRFE